MTANTDGFIRFLISNPSVNPQSPLRVAVKGYGADGSTKYTGQ